MPINSHLFFCIVGSCCKTCLVGWTLIGAREQAVTRCKVVSTPALKRQMVPLEADTIVDNGFAAEADVPNELDEHAPASYTIAATLRRLKRLKGEKIAKEEQRHIPEKDCAMRAHAKATTDVAAANMARGQVLRDQAALSFFTIRHEDRLSK